MNPGLSIIVPCAVFDDRALACLEALLQQRSGRDEVLLVLDGTVLDPGLRLDVRVLHLTHQRGPAAARNAGAAEARGEVLLFVDADVVLLSGMVERVRSFFSRNLGEAVFGCYDDAPAAPGLVSQYRNLQHHFVHLTNDGPASTFWAGCGAVLRKVFQDVGGFSEDFRHPSVEDIELGMRLTSAGHRIVLDANLRGKHLKSWSLPGMWVNDFQCRAVPWSRLILAGGSMPAGLNTGWASRLAVVAQGLALVGITLIPLHAAFLGVALALELLALLAHGPLLCFLARKRGLGFALRCVPLVMAYIVISGAGFAWAWGAWAGQRRRKTFPAARMPMGDIA